jgi:oligopeptide/dipeptide ABC transporter ATP-binding protein
MAMTDNTETNGDQPILRVRGLSTRFFASFGIVQAVSDVSFDVYPGETLGIVGESGSGKSVTAQSILRLVPKPGRIVAGSIQLDGVELLDLDAEEMRKIRGRTLSMVSQNPLTALNPALRIGWQLDEAHRSHSKTGSKKDARVRTKEMLTAVGIADADERADSYPHEYSGGMRQRIVIAMGMMNEPSLMIADEPTTALDVTIQAQVIELMKQLIEEHNMALVLITHNMGVVANMCDRVAVMYAGEIVEEAPIDELFEDPKHPYTWALLRSLPSIAKIDAELPTISGSPPDMTDPPSGCRFRARCPFAEAVCEEHPSLDIVGDRRKARCWISQRGDTFAMDDELLTDESTQA